MKAGLRFEVLKRDAFKCVYCGKTPESESLHVDHVIPRSRGGDDRMENLVTACANCNLGKFDTPLNSARPSAKRKITLYFDVALLEEARSVVIELGQAELEPSNLSALFGDALEHELERLRKRHNDGEPFPAYKSRLPGGRRSGKR